MLQYAGLMYYRGSIGLFGHLFLDFGHCYLLIWKTSSVEGLNSNLYFISLLKMGIL